MPSNEKVSYGGDIDIDECGDLPRSVSSPSIRTEPRAKEDEIFAELQQSKALRRECRHYTLGRCISVVFALGD